MNNQDQIDAWNGETGEKWAEHADSLNQLLSPFLPVILEAADLQEGEYVLDIGCGAGALSMEAAKIVGDKSGVCGVDVSSQLLRVARQLAKDKKLNIDFFEEDASLFRAIKPLDAAISRFGVMFFDKPTEAFREIRSNMKPEGRLAFSCWQNFKDNEWASAPGQIAKQFVTEPLPSPDPLEPGPFAFADKERIVSVLTQAGWRSVSVDEWDGKIVLPGQTLDESTSFILRLGPIARLLKAQDISLERVSVPLRKLLSERLDSNGSPALSGKAWIVTATAS